MRLCISLLLLSTVAVAGDGKKISEDTALRLEKGYLEVQMLQERVLRIQAEFQVLTSLKSQKEQALQSSIDAAITALGLDPKKQTLNLETREVR